MGRAKGTLNKATLLARTRAREILESDEYKLYFERRLQDDTLAPGVESMLWHYAYGKPTDKLEINDRRESELQGMSDEELAARAADLSRQIIARRNAVSEAEESTDEAIH